MTMTAEEARKAMENQYDIDRNQDRMIMALGKLQEAKGLIDEADAHNSLDELAGDLPVMGGEIGKQVYELKKVLGIDPNSFEKEVYEQEPKKEVIHDYLGLYELVGEIYKVIEAKDLSKAVSYAQSIQEMAIEYADPNSEANRK